MVANQVAQKLKLTAILLALLAGVLATSACNTWHGAGKDVQHAGQEMQEK